MSDKAAHPDSGGAPDEPASQTDASAADGSAAAESLAPGPASERAGGAAESGSTAAGDAGAGTEADAGAGTESEVRSASDSAEPAAAAPAAAMSTTSADTDAAGSGQRSASPRLLLAGLVAAVLLICAVGAAGYLFVQDRNKAELLAAHEEVRQAACGYAPVLANYDANNLDPYFDAVLAGATGDWKQEFETTTTELREALVAGQVVSTAGDIECAVKSADATSAEVVVVIGQTITSLGTQGQPAPGQLAMVMRMQKIDGRWMVDHMVSPLAATPQP